MIDPDTLYISSVEYRQLLDIIGDNIAIEDLAERRGDPIQASKHGLIVWDHLQKLMKMVQVASVFELDQRHATTYDLLFWAGAFAGQLSNANLKDKFFLAKHIDFCQSYVEMHSHMLNKDVRNLGNIRISLAETYYRAGKPREADALFRNWLSVEPDWGWGWIGWSDCYWLWEIPELKKDFTRAQRILEEGLSVPNVRDLNHVKERLVELLKRKRAHH
jgi:hypothetical protein